MGSQLFPSKCLGFLKRKQKQISEMFLIISKRKQILAFRCHIVLLFKLVVKAKDIFSGNLTRNK